MASPAVAPDTVTTLSGTFGGVQAPCCADWPACDHTLDPLRSQGPMPAVCHGTRGAKAKLQTYGRAK